MIGVCKSQFEYVGGDSSCEYKPLRQALVKRDGRLLSPAVRARRTNLYSARPKWLELAHKRLDDAVLGAYGWPRELGDEEILGRLLALNGERAGDRVHFGNTPNFGGAPKRGRGRIGYGC
jgi:hypothetical protein